MKSLYFSDIRRFNLLSRGKTKDIYEVSEDKILIVFTDRVAVGNIILPSPIPDRGKIEANITKLWMEKLDSILGEFGIRTHIVEENGDEFLKSLPSQVSQRSILCVRCSPTIKCIFVSKISQEFLSFFKVPEGKSDSKTGSKGIGDESKILFFSYHGGNEIFEFDRLKSEVGGKTADKIRELCFSIFDFCNEKLQGLGIELEMFEVEFGERNGNLYIIDSLLTPDSAIYKIGGSEAKFGKWFIYEYIKTIRWDLKSYPAPELPDEFIKEARRRYAEISDKLFSALAEQ